MTLDGLFRPPRAVAFLANVGEMACKDAKDFFLSGRSMPWWLVGVSMCAATTSTNSANMFTEFIRNSALGEDCVGDRPEFRGESSGIGAETSFQGFAGHSGDDVVFLAWGVCRA